MKLIFKIYKLARLYRPLKVRELKREEERLRKSIQDRKHEICILQDEYTSANIRNVENYRLIAKNEKSYESKLRQKEKELDQREKEINELQQKLNDQILKLGIVKGVNK